MKREMIVAFGLALLAPQATVFAATDPVTSQGTAVKVPQTADEHLAEAQKYRKMAETYRQQVADHRQMLDAYKISNPKHPSGPTYAAGGQWQDWVRDHCRKFIRDGENLAADADKLAELHESRAKELQGK